MLLSCQSGPAVRSDDKIRAAARVDFTTITRTEEILLFPERDTVDPSGRVDPLDRVESVGRAEDSGHSPRMNIALTLVTVPPGSSLETIIDELLYDGLDAQGYGDKLIAGLRGQYEETRSLAEDGRPTAILDWDYTEVIEATLIRREELPPTLLASVIGDTANLLVLSRSREYYFGGAHGMREKKYLVIDTAGARQITVDDLIRPDARPALQRRIEAELRAASGIGETVSLSEGGFFEDTVQIPEIFFFIIREDIPGAGRLGLGFHWDPYEIAPYVYGPIEIIIPCDEIAEL
jgi:hypothetical protein